LARIDKLNDVDELLDEHEREADASNDPGDGGIHLVGSGQFESGGAEGIREDLLQNRRVDLGTGLELGADLLDRLNQVGGDERRREAEEVERNEEQLVEGAEGKEDVLEYVSCFGGELRTSEGLAHLVGIVEAKKPVLARIDVLVARIGARDNKGGIHVHVVAGEIKSNQTLEDDGPSREGGGQEDNETGCGAAIRHHVEDGAEASRLFVDARDVAIEGVEETRDTVEERARARMEGHVVEGCDSEDDSRVAWRGCVSNENKA
jgi:hypothetical protein